MTKGELDLFFRIFNDYCKHFKDNRLSLMVKILGVFTVKSGKMDDVHIMLMENALQLREPERLKYIFDLKGSLVDRKVKGQTKNSTCLKDINFLMAAKANKGFTMMQRVDKTFAERALKRDIKFLREHGLMDYSLLMGIEKRSRATTEDEGRAINRQETQAMSFVGSGRESTKVMLSFRNTR